MHSLREWIKNVALFYVIILLMVLIPVIVVIVVVGIRTIIGLRYWITGGIFAFIFLIAFFIYRNKRRYKEKLRKNKKEVLEILEHAINSGHDVDISVMGGLLRISYRSNNKTLLSIPKKETASLPDPMNHNKNYST